MVFTFALQAQFKEQTGVEYKPGMAPPTTALAPAAPAAETTSCPFTRVAEQGELVRKLKAEKAPKVPRHLSTLITLNVHFHPSSHPFVSAFVCPAIAHSSLLLNVESSCLRTFDEKAPVSPCCLHASCMPDFTLQYLHQ